MDDRIWYEVAYVAGTTHALNSVADGLRLPLEFAPLPRMPAVSLFDAGAEGSDVARATLAAIGFAVGAAAIVRVPTAWLDETVAPLPPSLPVVLGVSPWLAIATALTLAGLGLAWLGPFAPDGRHWRWTATGLLLGGLGVLA